MGVREVARRLGLDQDRKSVHAEYLRLDHAVDRDIDFVGLPYGQVHAESECIRFHLRARLARWAGLLTVTSPVEILAYQGELALLLSVPNNRVGHCTARPIRNDS